jgi:hypothetical protein
MDCGQETVGTIKLMDVVVPVRRGDLEGKVRLRTVAKPEEDVAVLLSHLGLRLPSRSKRVQDVVEKNGSNLTEVVRNERKRFLNCGSRSNNN